MSSEPAIIELLETDVTISGIIGDRIFPNFLPEGKTRPAIIIEIDSEGRLPRNHGGLVEQFLDIEVQVEGLDYETARILTDAIRDRLDQFKGTAAGVDIEGVFLDDFSTRHVQPQDGRGIGYLVFLSEYKVWFREPVLSC